MSDRDYICNKNCYNNKSGWCKIFRQSTTFKKGETTSSCDFYLDKSLTGHHKIETAINSLQGVDDSDYLKGYKDGLKKALEYLNGFEVAMIKYNSKRSK